MKAIMAYRLYNRWLILALVLASILCAYLSPIDTAFAQLCPERWEASLQGLKDTYKPGENIDFTVIYLTRNPSDCPTCRQQIIVGMVDSYGKVIYVSCVYDGSPQTCPKETSGTGKISWKSPSDVGSYQILAANDYQNSCEDAKANFRVKSSNRLLATIQVSTSSPAASSTKSTGSNTIGSTQNPLSALQTWVQQIMNPSGTGTIQPDTTTTTPAATSGSPTAGFSSWFQQNQKSIFSVLALIIIAVLGLRYLINRKRGDMDKVITIILGAIAVGYLAWVYIIWPAIIWLIQNWVVIIVAVVAIIVAIMVALKMKWISFGPVKRSIDIEEPPISIPVKEDTKGYVYIMLCPTHKQNTYKVGCCTCTPEERARQLWTTGVPEKYVVIRKWKIVNYRNTESFIHKALDNYRVDPKREFFEAPIDAITDIIKKTIAEMKIDNT